MTKIDIKGIFTETDNWVIGFTMWLVMLIISTITSIVLLPVALISLILYYLLTIIIAIAMFPVSGVIAKWAVDRFT